MNFSPPYFTNGMFRRASSTSRWSEWCAARNSTACAFSGHALLAMREDGAADRVALLGLVEAGAELRPRASPSRVDHSVFSCRCGLSAITAFDAARIGGVDR